MLKNSKNIAFKKKNREGKFLHIQKIGVFKINPLLNKYELKVPLYYGSQNQSYSLTIFLKQHYFMCIFISPKSISCYLMPNANKSFFIFFGGTPPLFGL